MPDRPAPLAARARAVRARRHGDAGPIDRLGAWTATGLETVALASAAIALARSRRGSRVEHTLSGAGREATGSESPRVREIVDREFGGLSSSALMVVVHVVPPRPGGSIAPARRPTGAPGPLLLVPVALRLLGRWAWWLPRPLRGDPGARCARSMTLLLVLRARAGTPEGREAKDWRRPCH